MRIPKPRYKTNFDSITVSVDDYKHDEMHGEYSVLFNQGSIGNMQASYDEAVAKRKAEREKREAINLIDNMLKGI